MYVLDVVTILCAGLMVGNELAVSLFINPAAWRTGSHALVRDIAGVLGKVMPFWYALCLVLMGVEAWVRRGAAGHRLLLAAAVVWVGIIVVTIAALAPLNTGSLGDYRRTGRRSTGGGMGGTGGGLRRWWRRSSACCWGFWSRAAKGAY